MNTRNATLCDRMVEVQVKNQSKKSRAKKRFDRFQKVAKKTKKKISKHLMEVIRSSVHPQMSFIYALPRARFSTGDAFSQQKKIKE